MKYEPALDGLRALAVTAVVVYHAAVQCMRGGWAGVDAFFVLSGFLITKILRAEMTGSGKLRVDRFYARRALRLVPAFSIVLIFAVATGPFRGADFTSVWQAALLAGTYMMNWNRAFAWGPQDILGHTWSLAMEEQFYLLWPVVLIALRGRKTLRWLILAVIVETVWRCVLVLSKANPERISNGFDTHGDTLLIGCILALVYLPPAIIGQLRRFWVLPIAGFILLLELAGYGTSFANSLGPTVAALLTCWIIILALTQGPIRRFLSLRPLVFTGRISYGLYLWHFPLLLITGPDLYRHGITVLLGGLFVMTYAIATASYFIVERPFLRIKGRFAVQETGTMPASGPEPQRLPL